MTFEILVQIRTHFSCNHLAITYLKRVVDRQHPFFSVFAFAMTMLLELLHRIALTTSAMAALAWTCATLLTPEAWPLALTSAAIALATCLLTPEWSHTEIAQAQSARGPELPQAPQQATPPKRLHNSSKIAAIIWGLSGIGLAYLFFQTKIMLDDLGFFSPLAIILCWLCVIPLLLSRNNPGVRRIQSR